MSAIEQIYAQLEQVLGGTDPDQFFCMMIPGTSLDPTEYAYDTTARKPDLVVEAESRLVDQLFDVAQVVGASNGQRVSSQYLQALSVLVPQFDPMMPVVKNQLRAYLRTPAPSDATVNGQPFVGPFYAYYFALYEDWLAKKSSWAQLVTANEDAMTPELFLEWYEDHAEGQLALIDAAWGRLLAVFSPADMDAILGALAAGPGGALEEQLTQVQDLRRPLPNGGYLYPVDLTPDDWFLDLASDLDPQDLLQDPQFIAATIATRRQAIAATISQIQGLLAQTPTSGALAAAAAALSSAQTAYVGAQNDLLKTYASNTAAAVEMYLNAETGGALDDASALEQLDADAEAVGEAKGEAAASGASKSDGTPLTAADVQQLLAGQQKLIDAQSALVTNAQAVADAGMTLASDQAATFGMLPMLLARMQSQLAEVETLQSQIASLPAPSTAPPVAGAGPGILTDSSGVTAVQAAVATLRAGTYATSAAVLQALARALSNTALLPLYNAANVTWAQGVADEVVAALDLLPPVAADAVTAAQEAAADTTTTPTAASVLAAVQGVVPASPPASDAVLVALAPIESDASTAAGTQGATPADVVRATEQAARTLTDPVSVVRAAVEAALGPLGSAPLPSPIPSSITTDPISTVVDTVLAANPTPPATISTYVKAATAAASAAANPSDAVDAATAAGDRFTTQAAPAAASAGTSDRWMELQMSFTSSEMASDSSSSSLSSQTSWSVDLFFGSASGSSSSSSASVSNDSIETDTEIQIGMKVTKVGIDRGWFDPGVFKLSADLDRISTARVAPGPLDFAKATVQEIIDANATILPCFPVAFVVAKDVTFQFQVSYSSLSAVQTVLDSRSAVGGGFLCFSASSSSASHSDSSSLRSKTEGTVVTIHMPGPQVLGWFQQYLPADQSSPLTTDDPGRNAELNIIQFVEALEQTVGDDRDHAFAGIHG